jgi:dienelactone hydrolase
MFVAIALLVGFGQAKSPLDLAKLEIRQAAGAKAANVQVTIKPSSQKETYSISTKNGKVSIVGSDANGAMYGAFEFAERLHREPGKAWNTNAQGKPFLADRGLNLFLTLPWDYKKNDTDYDPAALTDPNRWWFHNEDYWKTLLDLMAHSRLNWLDVHGAWDISVTSAPNLYAYFVTSKTFPKVGVGEDIKQKNLQQLNHVIDMAHERGIRVSLMAYEANLKIPQNNNPGYEASENNIYQYTKEVVEETIRKAPKLDAIGYRIGESGRGESFFHCYGEAVKASGREIPIITRSWITRKQKVLPLARASKDFTVEIKYNGEQWGAPYMVAGGRMANWHSYSFEDYLSDSGDAKSEKTWPGNPAAGGGTWPSEPYKIVWQVRANGTHRIFPFYNPNWVRRTINEMKIGTASGYTIEGEDAYYPKSPDYYLADPKNKYCDWIHQRDEMYWMTWGRLGYDPSTPDSVFDKRAQELLGKDSQKLVEAWKDASLVVPKAFMAFSLGPDHRNHAPELEWGGDTNAFITGQGFDSLSFIPINEEFANRATGGIDGRFSVWDLSVGLSKGIYSYSSIEPLLKSSDARIREIAQGIAMQLALKDYYSNRFRSAHEMANIQATLKSSFRNANVEDFKAASEAFNFLAKNPYYRPFTERLRLRNNNFKWADEAKKVDTESNRIASLPSMPKDVDFWAANMNGPTNGKLTWKTNAKEIICKLECSSAERAWLLVKPLASSTYFHRLSMQKTGQFFEARLRRERWGYAVAAEALKSETKDEAARFPNQQNETPYLIVPTLPGPTPQFYNSEEAMTYLNPDIITPDKYSAMIVGTRSENFFRFFNKTTRRKLLEPVWKGLDLIILQQAFTPAKLDFLPKPLKIENFTSDVFDPKGGLGLEKASVPGAMWQRFLPSEGWEIFGNGGLARFKHGQGNIWVTTARLMQNMHYPDAARDFVKLLSIGGKTKPTILVDSCSEGGEMTSSCHPDLMNSHDIPFMTLGEVIAKEQKMDSFTPIPGPVANDDVLGGKGPAIASKFVRDQVVQLAKQPTTKNLAEFETLRVSRKKELMRSLGLDPMPAKTPLNARMTGTIQRNGYRIEKVVFESRPSFFVTAHVYVPNTVHGKLPVVVNVNGHWAHKKNEDRIQLRAAFQATQGYIAIAIDSPGWSFEGNSLIERRAEGNHNDFKLVQGGSNTTGYYVWDAIRTLDYMATRSDTDMSKIGLTGASGGGLATLYTFAADDRYTAAVPVVYMASMELAPDNGCLCNHVPATSQIGDRSDVMAIQAPKPVYLMGAENDGEFPPAATRLTGKKMQETWALFGKKDDVYTQIFGGGHDYNQLMREASIGFFNKYLKGIGNGSPVPQPPLQAIDSEDKQLLVLNPPAAKERTMRDLSLEYLTKAPKEVSAEEFIKVNGGVPPKNDLKWKELYSDRNLMYTFEPEPGLVTPVLRADGSSSLAEPEIGVHDNVLAAAHKDYKTFIYIYVNDDGKVAEFERHRNIERAGTEYYLDILGTGELKDFDLRFPIYSGRSVAFTGGLQISRLVDWVARNSTATVEVVGRGPMSSQAVMIAALINPRIDKTTGYDCLREWKDVFKEGIPDIAIQPRAHLCGSLENLRKQVKNGEWH